MSTNRIIFTLQSPHPYPKKVILSESDQALLKKLPHKSKANKLEIRKKTADELKHSPLKNLLRIGEIRQIPKQARSTISLNSRHDYNQFFKQYDELQNHYKQIEDFVSSVITDDKLNQTDTSSISQIISKPVF